MVSFWVVGVKDPCTPIFPEHDPGSPWDAIHISMINLQYFLRWIHDSVILFGLIRDLKRI